jgi:hypothetical protein
VLAEQQSVRLRLADREVTSVYQRMKRKRTQPRGTATLTSKGQLTIPVGICKRLALTPGQLSADE